MTVFVTDGDQRPALAITRSLGRRGISVLVGEERRGSLAAASRFCADQITYPSPYRQPEAFDRFLCDLVDREQIDVVVPVSDVTTSAVARHQETLRARCAVSVPSLEAFDLAADKWKLLEQAARCRIAIPETHYLENGGSLPEVLPRVSYPAVVKPARSRIRTADGWLSTSVAFAHSVADLRRLYKQHDHLARYPSLIQERVSGKGVGVFALCNRGELCTTFSHVRLREKPPSGGVSVLSESLAVDPVLRAQARRLLGSLGWHGVAMLEYKQDRRTGRTVLMEVNGRFWGSLQLAIDAGVDFPYLNHQLALGLPLDLPASYLAGERSRWWLGDLDHLISRLRHDEADLTDDAPTRWGSVLAFLKFTRRHQRSEVFRPDDPRPGLREMKRYVADLARSGALATRRMHSRPAHRADRAAESGHRIEDGNRYVRKH
jgi:predicted ATP-grasp superfamily ATP-dependent carboligase